MMLAGVLVLAGSILFGFIGVETIDTGISLLIYAGVGGLIVVRRDGHPTGWLLALLGLTLVLVNGSQYAPGLSPSTVTWIGSWGWSAVFALFALLTLTFPSGHLPQGPGLWARSGRIGASALPVLVAVNALTETSGGPEISKGTINSFGFLPGWLSIPMLTAIVVVLIGGVTSLVVKRRRVAGVERAQLTWVVFAFVLLATAIVITFAVILISIGIGAGDPEGDAVWSGVYVVMILFPLSFGVAVLRYRLYDIDRIISRTVAYGLVAVTLTAAYVAVVLGVGAFVAALSTDLGALDLPILATALVALAFQPVRQRALRVANGLVFGRRRTPYEALAGVGGGRLDELLPQIARLATESTAARSAIVWLSHGVELRPAAIFPDDGSLPEPVPIDNGHLLVVPNQGHTVPLSHQDDLLGAITVVMGPGENLPSDDRRLLDDLAGHAAVTLRGVLDATPLPAGIVTFLMTDIEGSTKLWENDPEAMAAALRLHDSMVRQMVADGGGVLVKWRGEGDSTFSVFTNAAEAVATAAALQDSIGHHPWSTPWPLSIRVALHTGEAELRERDYFGQTVNRCARLRLLARGGQTLVSAATRELAREGLPKTLTFNDLGEHQLKDMTEPERVYEVVARVLAVTDAQAHSDDQ